MVIDNIRQYFHNVANIHSNSHSNIYWDLYQDMESYFHPPPYQDLDAHPNLFQIITHPQFRNQEKLGMPLKVDMLNTRVNEFSVSYETINFSDIEDIHKYLMEKHTFAYIHWANVYCTGAGAVMFW